MRAGDGAYLQWSPVIDLTRFVRSTRDGCVHVLAPAGAQSMDGLMARCGQVLPTEVIEYDQPPPGPSCEPGRLMFLEDFTPGNSARRSGAAN